MKKVYLDNCAFNRPFDDQSQIRIRLESEAKLYLQSQIMDGKLSLIWSFMIEVENSENPFEEKRTVIGKWKEMAKMHVQVNGIIRDKALNFLSLGFHPKDSLHIASAIYGGADYFVTTDDNILRKSKYIQEIYIFNPIRLIEEITNEND